MGSSSISKKRYEKIIMIKSVGMRTQVLFDHIGHIVDSLVHTFLSNHMSVNGVSNIGCSL